MEVLLTVWHRLRQALVLAGTLVPGTWYLVPGTWYLVYLYLVPGSVPIHFLVCNFYATFCLNQGDSVFLGLKAGILRDFRVRRLRREHQQLPVVGPVQRGMPGIEGRES